MIVKNLWRRKIRTFLTLLGIAIGVGAVVALSAFGEGFASGFETLSANSDADLTVGQKDAIMLMISSVDVSVGNEIRDMPGVEEVAGNVIGFIQLPEVPYFAVIGQDPKSFTINHYKLIDGQMMTAHKQILLGKNTAENFEKKAGEAFRINDVVYRVAGIYQTGTSMEDSGIVMRLDDAQKAFDHRNSVNYFSVKVKDPARINEIKQAIEKRWDKLAAVRSGESSSQNDLYDLYRSFGWFLGVFAALVGGLGMMNTSVMSVLERTREIGVLRAVGWSRWRVMFLIFNESLLLAVLGGLLGMGLGVGMTSLANLSPAVSSTLSGAFKPEIFIQAMVMALVLGVLGGAYPAWRASRLAPVEAMRYEGGAGGSNVAIPWLVRFMTSPSLRNLWRRPARTLITMLSIGIGVGFIVALIAMTEGMKSSFNKLASSGQTDLMAEEANTSDLSLSEISDHTAIRLLANPNVASISKLIIGVSTAPGLPFFMVFGVDLSEEYVNHYQITEGRMLQGPKEIIVGRFAANGLKKSVGDTVRLGSSSFTIVGVYENGSVYENAGGTLSLKEAQALFNKPHTLSLIGIHVKNEARERIDEIASNLETQFPDIVVNKSSEFTENMQDFVTTDATLAALVILTVIVGGIVIMNAMLMSVFERTQEIGVLRALGWQRRRIIGMIVVESLVVSALSSVLGMLMGVGMNYLFLLEPTMGIMMTPDYTPVLFLDVFILSLVLGVIGAVYPAWKAAGLSPIEALRYE
jgi:ABC-type antimicrobial peptide transport system permease subunit